MKSTEVRKVPCEACPYRRDVPSGVWEYDEYEKLRKFEGSIVEQAVNGAIGGFACHATPQKFCHGWAVTADKGESLALRLAGADVPEAKVPLFDSHTEAADHGQRDYYEPDEGARDVAARLMAKHERIREGGRRTASRS